MSRVYDETLEEADDLPGEVQDLRVGCPICDRDDDAILLHASRAEHDVVVRRWECGCGAIWSTAERVSHHHKVTAPAPAIEASLRVRSRRKLLPYGVYRCNLTEHVRLVYTRGNSRAGHWHAEIHGPFSYKDKVSIGPADDAGADAPSLFSFEKAAASPKIAKAVEIMITRVHEKEVVREALARVGNAGLAETPPGTSQE